MLPLELKDKKGAIKLEGSSEKAMNGMKIEAEGLWFFARCLQVLLLHLFSMDFLGFF